MLNSREEGEEEFHFYLKKSRNRHRPYLDSLQYNIHIPILLYRQQENAPTTRRSLLILIQMHRYFLLKYECLYHYYNYLKNYHFHLVVINIEKCIL